jgi:hypothetical protein
MSNPPLPRKKLARKFGLRASPFREVVLVLALVAPLAPGCVRRTVTVNTKPEGATVMLNDEVVGTSPVTTDFLWYGDYDVIIRKPGYETLKTNKRLNAPWYQLPVFDFFSEIVLPFEFRDRQQMAFDLTPAKEPTREELLQNARQFRDRALYETD